MDKVRLKGHESFSIREGWIPKGIIAVQENPKIFSSKDATDILGMGTNMVKSLKYWLIACDLIEESKKNEYELTELGDLINKYDPFLEDIFTLFFIHINLVSNKEKATIWNLFFSKCNIKNFNKKDLLEALKYELETEYLEYNEKMLIDEINVLLKTYSNEDKVNNPENNFACPLDELNLLRKIDREFYEKNKPSLAKLDKRIILYYIEKECEENSVKSLNIDDFVKKQDGVCKILNLDKNTLNEYLEILKNDKLITLNKTAGLNMVYIEKYHNLSEVFENYFGKEV